jgi:hypothetical protein
MQGIAEPRLVHRPSYEHPDYARPASRERLVHEIGAVRIGGGYHVIKTPPGSRSSSRSRSESAPPRVRSSENFVAQAVATSTSPRWPLLASSGLESKAVAEAREFLIRTEHDYDTYAHGRLPSESSRERFSVGAHSLTQRMAISNKEAADTIEAGSANDLGLFRVLKPGMPNRSSSNGRGRTLR